MGGALGDGFTNAVLGAVDGVPRVGNWTQFAEFNVLADPEAAAGIFGDKELAGKTTLIPLDLSHLVLTTEEVRGLLLYGPGGVGDKKGEGKGKTRLRTMLVELLMFFARTYRYVDLYKALRCQGETKKLTHPQRSLRHNRRPPATRSPSRSSRPNRSRRRPRAHPPRPRPARDPLLR